MLLGALGASLLENLLTGKDTVKAGTKVRLEQARIYNATS